MPAQLDAQNVLMPILAKTVPLVMFCPQADVSWTAQLEHTTEVISVSNVVRAVETANQTSTVELVILACTCILVLAEMSAQQEHICMKTLFVLLATPLVNLALEHQVVVKPVLMA